MKNAKKLLALLLAVMILFSLCACGDDTKKDDKKDDDKKPAASQSTNADPSAAPSTTPTQNNNAIPSVSPAGVWYSEGFTMTLNADGTGSMTDIEMTANIQWSTNGNNITLKIELDGISDEVTAQYTVSDTQLILTNEEGDEVWTKKTAANDIPVDEPDVDVDVEITYDDELIAVWYCDNGLTMDLAEGGNGTLYFGDSEEYELEWGIMNGMLYLSYDDTNEHGTYEIDGDELTLTSEQGDTLTFVR